MVWLLHGQSAVGPVTSFDSLAGPDQAAFFVLSRVLAALCL